MKPKFIALSLALFLASCSHPLPAKIGMNNAAINAINSGMSYADVAAILGDPGLKDSETVVDGKPTAKYGWMAPNGFSVSASFQDGKLVSIAKVRDKSTPQEMLTVAEALIDALKSGQEAYVIDAGSYKNLGDIGQKFSPGQCSLSTDSQGIVNVAADFNEIAKSLQVHDSQYIRSNWKVAIDGTPSNFRIAVEGIGPDTKNLAAYYEKACGSITATDSDPTV